MRLSAILLLTLCASLAPAQELLRMAELDREGPVLERVLSALVRGEAETVAAAGSAVFLQPLTTGKRDDAGVVHHWRREFLALLAAAEPAQRAAIVAALERVADRLGPAPAAAMRLGPAPRAIAVLQTAADRAFDHGRLRDYLAIAAELDAVASDWRDHPQRRSVARALLGLAPGADSPLRLRQPGPLLPVSALPGILDQDLGVTVRWHRAEGHLVAADPWDQVRWQRPLEPRAQVATGPGAAAIRTERSLLVLDEDGIGSERPLASAVSLLGVRAGWAWLAVDATVHAVDSQGRIRGPWELAGRPLDAPLVQDGRSLWLTARSLELVVDGEVVLRYRHGLPAGDWRLVLTTRGPALSDGSSHRLVGSPRAEDHPPAIWGQYLIRAGRPDAALDWAAASDDPALDAVAGFAALVQSRRDGGATALPLVEDPQLALQLAVQAAGGPIPAIGIPALRAAAAAAPAAVVCGPEDDPRDHADHWRLTLSARALADPRASLGRDPGAEATPAPRPLASSGLLHPELGAVIRSGGLLLRVRQAGDDIVADVHGHADGQLRRRQRFPAAGFFLPTVGIVAAGELVLVAEGQSRIHVFDRSTGQRRGELRKPVDLPLTALVPLGGDRALALDRGSQGTRLLALDGSRRSPVDLPAAPRWLVPVADGAVVALADGQALRLPAHEPCDWPPELLSGGAPEASPAGLWRDGQLWPWQRAAD